MSFTALDINHNCDPIMLVYSVTLSSIRLSDTPLFNSYHYLNSRPNNTIFHCVRWLITRHAPPPGAQKINHLAHRASVICLMSRLSAPPRFRSTINLRPCGRSLHRLWRSMTERQTPCCYLWWQQPQIAITRWTALLAKDNISHSTRLSVTMASKRKEKKL